MKGRILLSTEGINGTLSCSTERELKEYIERMEEFDLIGEFGTPPTSKDAATDDDEAVIPPKAGNGHLFANIDWKTSTTDNEEVDPFPDLKIQIVKEIVNTGGAIHVDDIPLDTGKEISAEEFHAILLDAQQQQHQYGTDDDDTNANEEVRAVKKQRLDTEQKKKKKEVVLIDVRNTFEHAIGHFVHPTSDDGVVDGKDDTSPTPAINPKTVTFSHFDSTFCSQNSESLKDKKVMMYCTGGIRCVKASAMLKQRGVEDVSHLSGGIHRYLEKYGKDGFYKGKVFVFDQRVALDADSMKKEDEGKSAAAVDDETSGDYQQDKKDDVVGKCIECNIPYDEISGANLCSVCRDLILICPSCRDKLHEFHCERHQRWKDVYFTFLERFTIEELEKQKEGLQSLHDSFYLPAKKHKNVRKTLRKQMEKIDARVNDIKDGNAVVEQNAKRRCRTCFESDDICDGRCWGFWKHRDMKGNGNTHVPIMEVKVGDRVTVGPNWNEIRLGSRQSTQDSIRLGTVVHIKSWASGGDELDCVAVKWDKPLDCGRRRSTSGTEEPQSEIYRWGVLARNGQRMYDVRKIVTGDGDSSSNY
jgi:predicted sulfurtransferase